MTPLLEVKNLSVEFKSENGFVRAVDNVSFNIPKGETVALVGESGSGKSVTSLCTMGLLSSPPGKITGGEIYFEGKDLLKFSERQMRKIRGNRISMIFQEPMTSLNPVFTVGYQIVESLRLHKKLNKKQAWERATELLYEVGIPSPAQRVRAYPHELSGGQRQRVMIAMAIACEPDLLIADEPTTALDVTIQKQILDLMNKLKLAHKMSLLFITHDLGVVGDIADRVVVMYKGQKVEEGGAQDLFKNAQHPYTKGLIACRPTLDKDYRRLATVSDFMDSRGVEKSFDYSSLGERQHTPVQKNDKVLIEIKNLKKFFPLKKNFFGNPTAWMKAVDDVSLDVIKGRTLGLVGESGCGKTTLGRTLLRLIEPTSGQILYDGKDLLSLDKKSMREMRKKIQIIFQDPYASLNPRMTVGSAIIEPMTIHKIGVNKAERKDRAADLLEKVGLGPEFLNRYPHEFSGGQRQRICIARALAVKPEFIVCDESVSALDVSIQAQILNLLVDLKEEFKLTYIFISHDLAVVKFIADEVAVMNKGKIIEKADVNQLYNSPQNEYTRKLLNSVPRGL